VVEIVRSGGPLEAAAKQCGVSVEKVRELLSDPARRAQLDEAKARARDERDRRLAIEFLRHLERTIDMRHAMGATGIRPSWFIRYQAAHPEFTAAIKAIIGVHTLAGATHSVALAERLAEDGNVGALQALLRHYADVHARALVYSREDAAPDTPPIPDLDAGDEDVD
jgi:hypothetical protein